MDIKWSKEKPTEKGVFAWRGGPGSYAMVHVHTRPTQHQPGGQLNGSVIGGDGRHFYEGCSIEQWSGEWIGPFPQNER